MKTVKVRACSTAPLPQYQTPDAAALDLSLCFGAGTEIEGYNNVNNKTRIFPIAVGNFEGFPNPEVDYIIEIPPRWRLKIPLGIFTEAASIQWFALVLRSSFAWSTGLMIPNSVGVIDTDYRGQWFLTLVNPTDATIRVKDGQRCAQLIPIERIRVEWEDVKTPSNLSKTNRGDGGFGSTN